MTDVTSILNAIHSGKPQAAEELLPLVYQELRKLAARKLAHEQPGQTLDATALVHEAYLRLVGDADEPRWDHRGHFFAAAAAAMRRILVDRARRKASVKHGGHARRIELDTVEAACQEPSDELLALDEALSELEGHDAQAAQLVKLRFFAGLSHQDAAAALGLGRRAADRVWALARAWLFQRIAEK
ncbi:MAG TPA: ECF-type sigma factor [Pirellulales bacterium]|jgi:RNA polymerase sigma factor (TIGR02999 family)|nr:ECF-type sigma factor [Pirellulales bacterium]